MLRHEKKITNMKIRISNTILFLSSSQLPESVVSDSSFNPDWKSVKELEDQMRVSLWLKIVPNKCFENTLLPI